MNQSIIKLAILSSMALLLGACQNETTPTREVSSTEATQEPAEMIDKKVEISEDTSFREMSEDEKKQAYAALDEIDLFTGEVGPTADMSQIQNIGSETDYSTLLTATNDRPAIIYLGFDDCPFCKVFSPKINHLASEYGVEIHYYNTHERGDDVTFANAMQVYNVDTVPHAFIVEGARPGKKINHESTMAEIEAFIAEFAEQTS